MGRANTRGEHTRWRRRQVLTAGGAAFTFPLVSGVARAHNKETSSPTTVIDFDGSGLNPENIAIDKHGNIYMSMGLAAQIRRLPKENTTQTDLDVDDTELVAELAPGDGGFTTGVVADTQGTIYAARASFTSGSHGIWEIPPDGPASLLTGVGLGRLPNGIIPAKRLKGGTDGLLVTDSFDSDDDGVGDILHVAFDGTVTVWKQHALLAATTDNSGDSLLIGANGLAVDRNGDVFVANLDHGRIVRIPVTPDGSAGTPEVFVEDADLVGADGIVFDAHDHLYVAVNSKGKLVHIDSDGTFTTLADDLEFPSDVAFGTTTRGPPRLFFTEFPFGDADTDGRLMKLDAGIPGDVE